MKVISLEFYKIRHKHLFCMITLFIAVELLWGFAAVTVSTVRNPGTGGWEFLIIMLSSMNGFFLPILSAVCVSRICDMEHKGNTWKLLGAMAVRREQLYTAKYVCGLAMMFYACILQTGVVFLFGYIRNFGPFPVSLLIGLLLGSSLTSLVVVALQQWISMAVKNQAFALCLGMAGSFVGLTADLLPAPLGKFFIWSYYTGLSPVVQEFTGSQMRFGTRGMAERLPFMAALAGAGIILYLAGRIHVSAQDVTE